jgi:hypothetical protein
MNNNKKPEQNIRQIQYSLDGQNLRLQTCIKENEHIQRMVLTVASNVVLYDIVPPSLNPKRIVIANGKPLTQHNMLSLNEDNYDVILNCIERKLFARKDPSNHTKLKKSDCKNIGRDRLKLLRYMLENPKVPICEETIPYVYGDLANMSPNALAHSIRALRKCLRQAPYIITEPDWGESISRTGSVYLLNDKYKYLVIKYQI